MGGMSVQAEKLLSRLRQEGCEVNAVATNPRLPRALAWVESVPGVRTVVREIWYIGGLARRVRKCQVVHHLAASGFSFFVLTMPAVAVSKLFRKRIVLNYRGGLADRFLRRWAPVVVPVLKSADVLVVPSPFLQRVFAAYGVTAALLPNIADAEAFAFQSRHQFRPKVLVTRQLEPIYNVASIVRAFAAVQRRYPDAVLGIAGGGSEMGQLKALAESLALANVTFYGPVKPANLPALYAQHDVFVNASLVDNFPGSLVEAACAGLPIVTTRAGGIPDMIEHNHNGILTELEDDAGLVEGILHIVEDPALGMRLAANAHEWAQQFRWDRVYPELLRAYGFPAPAAFDTAASDRRRELLVGTRDK